MGGFGPTRRLLGIAACLVGLWPVAATAQFNPLGLHFGAASSRFELSDSVHLDEVDSATKAHLERVRAFVRGRQWDEAVETLRQIMETHGTKLVRASLEPYMAPYLRVRQAADYPLVHYLSLRDYCQMQLAGLPAEGRKLYRSRVDPQARQLFEAAMAQNDPAELARVVEQFFASSWGDDALWAAGELAFEQGQYGAAREAWQRLLPAEYWLRQETAVIEHRPPWLAYPDSQYSPPDVLARLALASLFEGSFELARKELDVLRSHFPEARGRLGGRDVNYTEALSTLLTEATQWREPAESTDWRTFAGDSGRNRVLPDGVDVGRVKWLELLAKSPMAEQAYPPHRVGEDHREPSSYFPLAVGNLLLVNASSEILAYDLRTGKPAWGPDPVIYRDDEFGAERRGTRSALGTPRFTMTCFGNRLYVRLGNPVTCTQNEQPVPTSQGYLACLDLSAEGRLVWRTEPLEEKWAFEGSPVADGEFIYVGLRRSDVRPQAHVACYRAGTGELCWRRMISSAETPAQGQIDEITHNLLTLVGPTLYYNTNLGAVAALSARDGHIQWLTVYRRASTGDLSQRASHFYRELTPCVYDRGKLFVAPADAPPILAVDAATGLLLWKAEPSADDCPTHLLGVAGGNLWASGDKLWWINVASGKRSYWPEGASSKTLGRGILAGGKVYWPTAQSIFVFDQASGQQAQQPIDLSLRGAPTDAALHGGNLLVAGSSMFIATGDKLFALDQYSGKRLGRDKPGPPGPTGSKRPADPPRPAPAQE